MIGVSHGLNTFTQHVGLGLNPFFFAEPADGPLVAFTLGARGSSVFTSQAALGLAWAARGRATMTRTAGATSDLTFTGGASGGQDFDA